MAELPFLVAHGGVVWKLLLAALVGGTTGLVVLGRRSGDRRRARMIVGDYLKLPKPIDDGDACMRGKIRGGIVATLANDLTTNDHADPDVWIECEGGVRVVFATPPRVIIGARAASRPVGMPKGAPEALRAKGSRWMLRACGEGDEVVVTGRAKRVLQGEAGYRDDASVWLLDGDPPELVAVGNPRKPGRLPIPMHTAAAIAGIATFALVWYGALRAIGKSAADRADDRNPRSTATSMASFDALAIAAAMPGSRKDALRTRAGAFFDHYRRQGSMFALHDELWTLVDPDALADRQVEQVRFEAAVETARAVHDPVQEAWTQLFAGNYAEALALSPKSNVREVAAIGVGNWKAAADAADAEAASEYGSDKFKIQFANHARCRASWYRHLAGSTEAFVSTNDDLMCKLYDAMLLAEPQRGERLRALIGAETVLPTEAQDSSALQQVIVIAQVFGDLDPEKLYSADIAFGVYARDWLASFEPPQETKQYTVHAARAGTAMIRGDFAAARSEAALIPDSRARASTEMTIALQDGGPLSHTDHPHPALVARAKLREGTVAGDIAGVYPTACEGELARAVPKALAGDGGPLAEVLATCNVYYIYIPKLLFGVLPHVTQHRAELADALRALRDSITAYSLDHVPYQLLVYLAEYRDLARLAGDTDEAKRFDAMIARHAKVLADRDRAIALALLAD